MSSQQRVLEVLRAVQAYAQAQQVPCYLVGGMLRDQLLGRPPRYYNVDLVVPRAALAFTQELARSLRGAFVPLDEEAGTARIVVEGESGRIELDISEFRGPTLQADLALRDFTINAIAIALPDWLKEPARPHPLIDPLHGQQALTRKQLTPCSEKAFQDDPVRILRAFRFVAQLEVTLEATAIPLMARAVSALAQVSGERVRDELLAMFETDRAHPALQNLHDLGVLDVLIPELSAGRGVEQGGFHHLDVMGHQLETVAQADRILRDFAEFIAQMREPFGRYCAVQLVERRSRKSLIKLAGLLHDVGKPATRQVHPDGEVWFLGHEHTGAELVAGIVERLRLSNREASMVCQLVRHHLRPGFLSRESQLTRRAIYRFYKDLGDEGPACLLTWWADRMATRGPKSRLDQLGLQRAFVEEMARAYFFQAQEVIKPPRLITGHQLMETFHLAPGPLIGQLLGAIEEAQAEGQIQTIEDALQLARDRLASPTKE